MEPTKKRKKYTKKMSTPEREEKRRDQKKKYDMTRVRIGRHIDRWQAVKLANNCVSDVAVAQLLLDRYDDFQVHLAGSPIVSSTPFAKPKLSSQEQSDSDTGSDISGISPMQATAVVQATAVESQLPHDVPSSSTAKEASYDLSVDYEQKGSFIYPLEGEDDSGSDGSVWESEGDLSDISDKLNESHPIGIEDVDMDDIVNCCDASEETSTQDTDESSDDEVLNVDVSVETTKFIAFESSLRELLKDINVAICTHTNCQDSPQPSLKFVGTAVSVQWICSHRHVSKRWDSQPKARRNYAGDIALSAAIVFSGNNYAKIATMLHHMKMGITNRNLHFIVQREYTFPAIEEHWQNIQNGLLENRRGKKVTIAGDGRNDSPGFSAQYCTYTTMDYDTGDILDVRVVDKRESSFKSPNMEKMAFEQMLQKLQGEGLLIQEIITDAHQQITAFLRQYPDIFHSYDVWHGAKNVGKKMAEAAKKAKNRPLLAWTGDVTRHFWYCAQNCEDNTELFLARWRGLLHHVVGEHEWALGDGVGSAKCDHGSLPEEWATKKLDAGGPAHETLTEIVLSERLLKKLHHFQRFRFTHKLENFQSHILAYAAKRYSYGPPAYKARNYLAALDYQYHKDRNQKTKDDQPVFGRRFAKASNRWTVYPVMEKKTFEYIPGLMKQVFRKRLQDEKPQRRLSVLSEGDPRLLAANIYPIPPPSVQELLQSHKPRM